MTAEHDTPAPPAPGGAGGEPEVRVDADVYDVLRARLGGAARELAKRAEALNRERQRVFGSAQLRLDGTERLRTERPSLPADVAPVGPWLLFAANPAAVTDVSDVFRLRPAPGGAAGLPEPHGLLDDPQFVRDFGELYRYYRETRVLRLRVEEGRLLAVFRTGPAPADVRALGWRVGRDGACSYEGARREADPAPGAGVVTWLPVAREHVVPGRRPHIAVTGADGGTVQLTTTGGTLRIRTGETGYEEPVEDALQSLADAQAAYAVAGPLVLLRVRPYHEDTDRHFVVNTRTGRVERIDALAQVCLRLPDEQGVVFPGGCALAAGGIRTFDLGVEVLGGGLEFERLVRSANGEDVLYVFHAAAGGRLLLPYNLIREEAGAPMHVQGCALYEDGTLLVLRPADGAEPARVHTLQRWRSPFLADTCAAAQPVGDGPLERIGNPDLVRAVADALSVARSALAPEPAAAVHEALVAAAERVLDRHHWLADPGTGNLAGPLTEVRDTGRQVLAEYARVRDATARAAASVEEAARAVTALGRRIRGEASDDDPADAWVARLTELRRAHGRLVTLRDVRHADQDRLDALEAELARETEAATARAAACFADERAFDGYRARVAATAAEAAEITTSAAAEPLAAALDEQAAGLTTVTGTAGTLRIADATVRTRILELAADVLGSVNHARAVLDTRRRELFGVESAAEFAAESALLAQDLTGVPAAADSPERCEEELARLLVQVENLTTRFAGAPERVAALDARREEIHHVLTTRKQALADQRAEHVERLTASAARVLDSVRRRAAALATPDDVNAFFAADPLVAEHRRLTGELGALGQAARAAELTAALAAARQDADRTLRDHLDLYEAGGTAIRLGAHRFAVNPQPLGLALVPHGDAMAFTVTGTDYLRPVAEAEFAATRPFWSRPLISESPGLYRAEYLAGCLLLDGAVRGTVDGAAEGTASATVDRGSLSEVVREAIAARPAEGYERGVHDRDAVRILAALAELAAGAGLLRHPSEVRAAAQVFWTYGADPAAWALWGTRARSLARAAATLGQGHAGTAALAAEISAAAETYLDRAGLPSGGPVGAYLVAELADGETGFVVGPGAEALREEFTAALGGPEGVPYKEFAADLEALGADVGARWQLAAAWLGGFPADPGDRAEAVAGLVCGAQLLRYRRPEARVATTVDGLLGAHPRVTGGRLPLRLDELLARVGRFRDHDVPAYRAYQRQRAALVAAESDRLRLAAYRPRPVGGFVRNRLLDEVYLPLVGDSLAKQFGAPGGLLMLMSPPGYGKTSLMEYVAARLGLALVGVSGPALGGSVTSLDPDRAPDAAARRELEKIDLALSLGSNVLLHLDDIQHTSPELLQKFIPLCDAQRRIEGARGPYDLRGKRFAVCMSGNPYTESGRLFRVPDMLAGRADVWNLGDVLTGREDLFALSYLENALTANDTLAPLAGRDRGDLELLIRLAEGDPTARPDDLQHPVPAGDRTRVLTVLRHLLRARGTLLAVNAAYIASAARADESRTGPPFLLQGSYRDMARIAGRITPAMNQAEADAVVTDHYRAQAQTLASGAEAALLQLAALRGTLTAEQAARRAEVDARYPRR
ncbi:DNA repair ATPase [Streptomyces sp. NBC_01476]|uniref:DNA repair ATPase n=1 Tax=Streptomyces sp. NBC_01476 TaxID=2903881 RepID=UPI002E358D97|nr:DNA repair ATPase [Streptomyces sp. NBC_01476]